MLPAAGDRDDVIGTAAQFLPDIVDQELDAAVLADHARQSLAADRFAGSENHGFRPQHPFAPAQIRRQILKLAVEQLFGVKVKAVNTTVTKGKVKKFRGKTGRRRDVKKAYVTLVEGNTIDVSTGL